MTKDEYFGSWLKVIDSKKLDSLIPILTNIYAKYKVCPEFTNIFKAFNLCKYEDLKIVFIGQDPYPQRGIATGILFGNSSETSEKDLSPSLKVIKNATLGLENTTNSIIFDTTLESWCKQGILMLNSSLTVELNNPGSHTYIWRPFIKDLLIKLSEINNGIIYVLFGSTAKSFSCYLNNKFNTIIKVPHPAYLARMDLPLNPWLFIEINKLIKEKYNSHIEWYKEIKL